MNSLGKILAIGGALSLAFNALAGTCRADGDRVYVNEMLVYTFRYGNADYLSKRAEFLASKIAKLDPSAPLTLKVEGSYAKLLSGDEVILTISPDEAAAQNQSADELGNLVETNIKDALSLPAIQLGKTKDRLKVGEKEQIATLGSEVDQATITCSNPNVVAYFHKNDVLYLRATSLGQSTITFTSPSSTQSILVNVEPLAAGLPQTVDVEVTGDPTTKETVQGVVEGALNTKLQCQPGAQVDYTLPSVQSLGMEANGSYLVPVKVSAPDSFATEGTVTVNVHNLPLADKQEEELWYSNDPEDVRRFGNLFAGELHRNEAARLLYHHDDAMDEPLDIEARIINSSNQSARVLIIPGDSRPEKNPVLAGYRAGDQFLRNWIKYSGEIVELPAHSALPICLRKLEPGQTTSGLCYLRLLDGPDSLLVRTDAVSIDQIDPAEIPAYDTSTPWRVVHPLPAKAQDADVALSAQVFPRPFKSQNVTYRVGGKFGFVFIGQKPIRSADNREALDGNFGVMYTIHAEMVNPTSEPTDVEIVFESSAGYSGGLFVVDGNLIKTPLLQPKEEVQLLKMHLDAGESKQVTVLTCPLSGGSYPATLTVRPILSLDEVSRVYSTKSVP